MQVGKYKFTQLPLLSNTAMRVVIKNERLKPSFFSNEKNILELAGLVGIPYSTNYLFVDLNITGL